VAALPSLAGAELRELRLSQGESQVPEDALLKFQCQVTVAAMELLEEDADGLPFAAILNLEIASKSPGQEEPEQIAEVYAGYACIVDMSGTDASLRASAPTQEFAENVIGPLLHPMIQHQVMQLTSWMYFPPLVLGVADLNIHLETRDDEESE